MVGWEVIRYCGIAGIRVTPLEPRRWRAVGLFSVAAAAAQQVQNHEAGIREGVDSETWPRSYFENTPKEESLSKKLAGKTKMVTPSFGSNLRAKQQGFFVAQGWRPDNRSKHRGLSNVRQAFA